jgi:hypothetical protein
MSSHSPLGVELEVFVRREDADRFIEVRGDDPELAGYLRIEERGRGGRAELAARRGREVGSSSRPLSSASA